MLFLNYICFCLEDRHCLLETGSFCALVILFYCPKFHFKMSRSKVQFVLLTSYCGYIVQDCEDVGFGNDTGWPFLLPAFLTLSIYLLDCLIYYVPCLGPIGMNVLSTWIIHIAQNYLCILWVYSLYFFGTSKFLINSLDLANAANHEEHKWRLVCACIFDDYVLPCISIYAF